MIQKIKLNETKNSAGGSIVIDSKGGFIEICHANGRYYVARYVKTSIGTACTLFRSCDNLEDAEELAKTSYPFAIPIKHHCSSITIKNAKELGRSRISAWTFEFSDSLFY